MSSELGCHPPLHTNRLTTLHQVQRLPTICLRDRNKIASYFGVRPMAFVSVFSQWCDVGTRLLEGVEIGGGQ